MTLPLDHRIRALCAQIINSSGLEFERLVRELQGLLEEQERQQEQLRREKQS